MGKILVNCTVKVKAIDEEKFGKLATVSAYAKYIFGVFVNIGDVTNSSKFVKFDKFSPAKYFPYMVGCIICYSQWCSSHL